MAAGVDWDAVRVPAHIAGRVRALLGDLDGALIRDPCSRRLTWLTAPGATATWTVRGGIDVLSLAAYVEVPPATRTRGPLTHWAVPWTGPESLTPADRLCAALTGVLTSPGEYQ